MSLPRALALNLPEDGGTAGGTSQFVETQEVLPSTFDQRQVRFLLPRAGILAADSFFQFQVTAPNNANYFFPISVGAMGCIDSATMTIGGVQVAQTRSLSHRYGVTNSFRSQRERSLQQSIRVGVTDSFAVDSLANNATTGADMQVGTGRYGVDVNQPFIEGNATNNSSLSVQLHYRACANTSGTDPTPEWRVYLADLFPGMSYFHLPLQLLEQVTITINFTDDDRIGRRLCCDTNVPTDPSGNPVYDAGTAQIALPKMHLSLVHYDDPVGVESTMDKMKRQFDEGLNLVFTDDQFVRSFSAASTVDQVTVNSNLQLGLDGQNVRSVLISTPKQPNYAAGSIFGITNNLMGDYGSEPGRLHNSLQLNINAANVFPKPLENASQLYGEFSQVYPMPASIPAFQYSFVGQVNEGDGVDIPLQQKLTDRPFMTHEQRANITANKGYLGINLSSTYENVLGAGTVVNQGNPVVLNLSQQGQTGGIAAKDILLWAICERQLAIKGGKVAVSGS